MWVRFSSLEGVQTVAAKGPPAGPGSLRLALEGQQLALRFTPGPIETTPRGPERRRRSEVVLVSGAALCADTWYQVVASCGPGGLRLWVGGALAADNTVTSCLSSNTGDLIFGAARLASPPDSALLGSLDDLALAAGQLGPADMRALAACARNRSVCPATTTTAQSGGSNDTSLIIVTGMHARAVNRNRYHIITKILNQCHNSCIFTVK